jgi:hypothetical protein
MKTMLYNLRSPRCLFFGSTLLVASCLTALAQDNDPSLKLHFNFDQNFSAGEVLDVSGNGNNGWQFDSTNWIGVASGVFGTRGAQFTYAGSLTNDPPRVHTFSQYIGVTNVNGFYIMTNATFSFWLKFDTNDDIQMFILSAGYPQMYAFDPNAASNSWTINRNSSSYLSFITYPLGIYHTIVASWPDDTIQPGGFTPILATTNFHMYSITIDCTANQAITYYDGRPYMTNTIDLPWIRVYGTIDLPWLCVGAMGHDGTPQWGDDQYPNVGFFVGQMDDVRIYNRTLSAAEMYGLYYGSPLVSRLKIHPFGAGAFQICWTGQSNTLYQVDYSPSLSLPWVTAGAPVLSSGGSTCFSAGPSGQPIGYYRVRALY